MLNIVILEDQAEQTERLTRMLEKYASSHPEFAYTNYPGAGDLLILGCGFLSIRFFRSFCRIVTHDLFLFTMRTDTASVANG